jgi:hypothetical protein
MKGSRRISAAQRAAMKARREEKSAAKIAAYMRGQERITKLVRAENDSYKVKREAAASTGVTLPGSDQVARSPADGNQMCCHWSACFSRRQA